MTQESIICAYCKAVGWTKAATIDERVKKKVHCGSCGCINNYVKKPWKSAVMKKENWLWVIVKIFTSSGRA